MLNFIYFMTTNKNESVIKKYSNGNSESKNDDYNELLFYQIHYVAFP